MTHTKNPKNGNSHTAEEHCSFCGKHHSEVLMLFQGGSGARICNECIEQGYHTLVEHHVVADPLSATPPMQQTPLHYEELLKPAQIKEMLDQIRHRSGGGQTLPVGSGLQSLQTHSLEIGRRRRRDRDRQVERRARRPDGNGQDAHGTHDRAAAERPLHHRRRHGAHRSRLRGRRRGEHPLAAVAGGLLRRGSRRTGHRLHRRDRRGRPQGRSTLRSRATYRAKGCSRRC